MKTWMVTGCSSGIGRGIAKAALAAGNQVVLTARNTDTLKELRESYPKTSVCAPLDITNEEQIGAAVKAACDRFGTIDVLVNNAGYGYRAAIEESEKAEVQRLFAVNVFGPLVLIQKVLPVMRKNRQGTIVNVTSMGGVRGAVGNGMYSAAKGALELLSDTLYKECQPLGIRVLTVEPGAFRTSFFDNLKGTGLSLDDYAETAGKWHIDKTVNNRNQPGNPDKAGSVIVEVVNGKELPKRLALGSDAVSIIKEEYEKRLAELENWKGYSVRSDYEV